MFPAVTVTVGDGATGTRTDTLTDGSAVAVPPDTPYRLADPSADCELLDVTLPASVVVERLDNEPVEA